MDHESGQPCLATENGHAREVETKIVRAHSFLRFFYQKGAQE